MKLKLKDITYIKTYRHQSCVNNVEVQCELENPVDKYAVCLKTSNGTIVGHLKKGKSGRLTKTIFYHLRSHPQVNCTAKVTGKRLNLGDGEGLQVPCILQFTGERKFISVLKEQFNLLKEKKYWSRGHVKYFGLANVRVIGGSSYRAIFMRKY